MNQPGFHGIYLHLFFFKTWFSCREKFRSSQGSHHSTTSTHPKNQHDTQHWQWKTHHEWVDVFPIENKNRIFHSELRDVWHMDNSYNSYLVRWVSFATLTWDTSVIWSGLLVWNSQKSTTWFEDANIKDPREVGSYDAPEKFQDFPWSLCFVVSGNGVGTYVSKWFFCSKETAVSLVFSTRGSSQNKRVL